MKQLLPAIVIGFAILLFWLIPKMSRKPNPEALAVKSSNLVHKIESHIESPKQPRNWNKIHQRVVGLAILIYGLYLATLTGTITQFVILGIGAIGGGAAAGAGVGMLTYLVLGTVGAVTGGAGVALGILAMSLIGGGVGAIGAAAGGAGFRTLTYPLVSSWFWAPIAVLGIYVFLGVGKRKGAESIVG